MAGLPSRRRAGSARSRVLTAQQVHNFLRPRLRGSWRPGVCHPAVPQSIRVHPCRSPFPALAMVCLRPGRLRHDPDFTMGPRLPALLPGGRRAVSRQVPRRVLPQPAPAALGSKAGTSGTALTTSDVCSMRRLSTSQSPGWDQPMRPATMVRTLVRSLRRAAGTENGSSGSTARSARLPGSREPRSASMPHP